MRAWAGVDFLRFGPMAQDGRYERFAFFPDVHGVGARQIRGFLVSQDEALLKPGAIAKQSAAVQGLPALESLLFPGKAALLLPAPPEPFRCKLAVAVAENTHTIAGEALAGWQGDESWATLLEKPAADNPVYRTHTEAMTEILKAILTGIEQVRDQRLASGALREGQPRPLQCVAAGACLYRRLGRSAAALRRCLRHPGPLARIASELRQLGRFRVLQP